MENKPDDPSFLYKSPFRMLRNCCEKMSREQTWFGCRGRLWCEGCDEMLPRQIHIPPPTTGICWLTQLFSESIKWGNTLSHLLGMGPHFCTFFLPSHVSFFILIHCHILHGRSFCLLDKNKEGASIAKMMSKVRAQNSKLLCLWVSKTLTMTLQPVSLQ